MLEIKNLWAGYADKNVLREMSFTARKGQVTAVLGPNGCGKSTLLKSLCGIVPAEKGEILLDGESILSLPQKLLAQKVAYLAQGRQVPDISVQRMVLHGRFPYLSYPRRYREQDYAAARDAMDRMDLASLADIPLNQLSGGQRQKVYIAMALAQDTPVLLLDEPTTYLDVSHQLKLMALARTLADEGKHIIMVVHDISHAFRCADSIVLMQEGRAVFQGSAEVAYFSGETDKVFGVRLRRAETAGGWHYYCEEG